jgi:hypothetical protein
VESLTERNEKLNGADNILQENDELRKKNASIEEEKQYAEKEALYVKRVYENKEIDLEREYEEKEKELKKIQKEAEQAKKDAERLRDCQNEIVNKRAEEIYSREERLLQNEYIARTNLYRGFLIAVLLYGILITSFTATRSDAFKNDFKTFFCTIGSFLCMIPKNVFKVAKWASKLGDMIPQPIVAAIIHWILLILVLILVGGALICVILFGMSKIIKFYIEQYADSTSLAVFLISIATTVWFGDKIRTLIPINLLLMICLIHGIYICIRYIINIYGWSIRGWIHKSLFNFFQKRGK